MKDVKAELSGAARQGCLHRPYQAARRAKPLAWILSEGGRASRASWIGWLSLAGQHAAEAACPDLHVTAFLARPWRPPPDDSMMPDAVRRASASLLGAVAVRLIGNDEAAPVRRAVKQPHRGSGLRCRSFGQQVAILRSRQVGDTAIGDALVDHDPPGQVCRCGFAGRATPSPARSIPAGRSSPRARTKSK